MMFIILGQYLSNNEEEVLCWVKKLEAARKDTTNTRPLVAHFTERELLIPKLLAKEEKPHSISF